MLLFLSIVLPYALAHVEDVDSLAYRVVARHLVEDGTPFRLRYLEGYFQRFYEHPPLMFWVWAAVMRTVREPPLPAIGVACGVGTVLAGYGAGRALLGHRAAFAGALLLVSVETFFRGTANTSLDPPLVLAFTSSVYLAVTARGSAARLVAAGLVAGLGALVKGPPALGAPVAAWLVLAIAGRRREVTAGGWALVLAGAAAAPGAFLLYDHWALGGAWWREYVVGQVVASTLGTGISRGGSTDRWYLLRACFSRFPHGVLLAAAGLVLAARRRDVAALRARGALLAWALLVVTGYSLARRAQAWYLLPALVPIALAGGAAVDDLLPRARGATSWLRRLSAGTSAVLLLLVPTCTGGGRRPLGIGPCWMGPIPEAVARSGAAAVAFVAPPDVMQLWTHAVLAEHARVDPILLAAPEALAARPDISLAVIDAESARVPAGWHVLLRHEQWALAAPSPAAAAAR